MAFCRDFSFVSFNVLNYSVQQQFFLFVTIWIGFCNVKPLIVLATGKFTNLGNRLEWVKPFLGYDFNLLFRSNVREYVLLCDVDKFHDCDRDLRIKYAEICKL